jgi:hypothetical protein
MFSRNIKSGRKNLLNIWLSFDVVFELIKERTL